MRKGGGGGWLSGLVRLTVGAEQKRLEAIEVCLEENAE